jgi:hypothetical protein
MADLQSHETRLQTLESDAKDTAATLSAHEERFLAVVERIDSAVGNIGRDIAAVKEHAVAQAEVIAEHNPVIQRMKKDMENKDVRKNLYKGLVISLVSAGAGAIIKEMIAHLIIK